MKKESLMVSLVSCLPSHATFGSAIQLICAKDLSRVEGSKSTAALGNGTPSCIHDSCCTTGAIGAIRRSSNRCLDEQFSFWIC